MANTINLFPSTPNRLQLFTYLLAFVFLSTTTTAQVFYTEDFEDMTYDFTASAFCNTGGDFFTITDGSDISETHDDKLCTFYFAAQDLDGSTCPDHPAFITFDDLDISGKSNVELCIYIAESDDGTNQDWDASDYFHIDYDVDNSGTLSNGLWVENDGATFNSAPFIDTDFDGTGDGDEITNVFTQYCFDIPAGTTLDLSLEFNLDSGDEDIGIDHITLEECNNEIYILNSSETESIRFFTEDAAGVETYAGFELAPCFVSQGQIPASSTIVARHYPQNHVIATYTVTGDACEHLVLNADMLSCDNGTGAFNTYLATDGSNNKQSFATTMVNGPFDNQLYSDNISNIVGVSTNKVYLVDPTGGNVVRYIFNNGWYNSSFTSTMTSGGSSGGMTWVALASSGALLGVNGNNALILGSDGTIDTYSLSTGAVVRDNAVTDFENGPLMGTTLASATIVGVNSNNTYIVLDSDGTLIEYSVFGRIQTDHTATDLTGGFQDGSTFAAESAKIVGAHLRGASAKAFIFESCVAPSPLVIAPPNIGSIAPQVANKELTVNAFPNPLLDNGILNLNIQVEQAQDAQVTMVDASGKVWKTLTLNVINNGTHQVDMTDLPLGIYFMTVRTANESKVIKIVK